MLYLAANDVNDMVRKIEFANYKVFKSLQRLEIRPLTVLIGKNSAGKSAVAKLPFFLSYALQGATEETFLWKLGDVELGAEFRDLLYGRAPTGKLHFSLQNESETLDVHIAAEAATGAVPEIVAWRWSDGHSQKEHERGQAYRGITWRNEGGDTYPRNLSFEADYLGPIRSIPDRIFFPEKKRTIRQIGYRGEHAYALLYHSAIQAEDLLLEQVNSWYQTNFEGWGVRVNRERDPYFEVELTWQDRLPVNLRDVGEGMSQVLPVIVRAFMPANSDTVIAIEQPELHLHPAAHGNLAQLFAEQAKAGRGRYLIETHSENFVLRLRRLVAEKELSPSDLIIYFVDFDEEAGYSNLTPIAVDAQGSVSNWPEHIFNEALDEAMALRAAQVQYEKHGD